MSGGDSVSTASLNRKEFRMNTTAAKLFAPGEHSGERRTVSAQQAISSKDSSKVEKRRTP
jgi:hypothetical protein